MGWVSFELSYWARFHSSVKTFAHYWSESCVFHSWNWLNLGVFKLFSVLVPVDKYIKKKCYLLLLKFSDFFAWWIFDNTACKVHGHVFMFVSQFSFQISHFKKQRALLGIMKLFLASLSTFLLIIVTDGWEIWFFSIFTLLF